MAQFDLGGRVAVVTGGNGGIGYGIATALGHAGATVAVWGRDEAKTARAVERLDGEGISAVGFRCDVGVESDVTQATEETVRRLGRLDICVANAGKALHVPFLDSTLEEWNDVLTTDLTGVYLCFREAARHMAARDEGGALIAVSSIASRHAAPLMHSYGAAKAGISGLVRASGRRAGAARHPRQRADPRLHRERAPAP